MFSLVVGRDDDFRGLDKSDKFCEITLLPLLYNPKYLRLNRPYLKTLGCTEKCQQSLETELSKVPATLLTNII